MHDSSDVVSLVQRLVGLLPVLRIRAGHYDFDDELVGVGGRWDWGVDYLGPGTGVDEDFLHGARYRVGLCLGIVG